jgi:hypothetical protein
MTIEKKRSVTPPKFSVSGGFANWLKEGNGSLVFTARRFGKVVGICDLVGLFM